MLAKKRVLGVVAVFTIVGLLLVGQSISQPGQRGGQRGQRGQRGQFDPEQMRQMMEQRMQEALGATDTEWKVLGPRVMKVQELNRQANAGGRGMMMMFGRRRGGQGGPGGPGGPGGDQGGRRGPRGMNREQTEVEKIQQTLRTTLEDTSATPDTIKQQLTQLRQAKEKAKQDLAKAQQDLRQVLTLRQEAVLVLMGMLN